MFAPSRVEKGVLPDCRPVTARGVAILFAVLLTSVVLVISLSIFNITYKQLLLSSLARESRFAFYAQDIALDCIRHYLLDNENTSPFGYWTLSGSPLPVWGWNAPSVTTIACAGQNDVSVDGGAPPVYTFTLYIPFYGPGGQNDPPEREICAKATVEVDNMPPTLPGAATTTVIGYSLADSNPISPSCPLLLDRTVEQIAIERP